MNKLSTKQVLKLFDHGGSEVLARTRAVAGAEAFRVAVLGHLVLGRDLVLVIDEVEKLLRRARAPIVVAVIAGEAAETTC